MVTDPLESFSVRLKLSAYLGLLLALPVAALLWVMAESGTPLVVAAEVVVGGGKDGPGGSFEVDHLVDRHARQTFVQEPHGPPRFAAIFYGPAARRRPGAGWERTSGSPPPLELFRLRRHSFPHWV